MTDSRLEQEIDENNISINFLGQSKLSCLIKCKHDRSTFMISIHQTRKELNQSFDVKLTRTFQFLGCVREKFNF